MAPLQPESAGEASGVHRPRVTIVGRPNVGKSTLFNRLAGWRKAVVQKESGTTRDVLEEVVSWGGRSFVLQDTGGLIGEADSSLQAAVERQVERAMARSDLLLWVVDLNDGRVPLDERIAAKLRRLSKRTILVVNKLDSPQAESEAADFFSLGFPEIFPVSALHGHGTGDLLDRVTAALPGDEESGNGPRPSFRLAIVGEPNSGKSTYFNHLLKKERVVVSDKPLTTRDAIEEWLAWKGEWIGLVDTAGYQLRRRVKEAAAFFSMARTREAIGRADIVLLFFDASAGFRATSKAIFRLVCSAGKGCVLVGNKSDLVEVSGAAYERELRARVPFLENFPFEGISALRGERILKPVATAYRLWEAYGKRISTRELNAFMKMELAPHLLPRTAKVTFIVQNGVQPPSFKLFVKHARSVGEASMSFVRNKLIRKFDLEGIPVRLHVIEAAPPKRKARC